MLRVVTSALLLIASIDGGEAMKETVTTHATPGNPKSMKISIINTAGASLTLDATASSVHNGTYRSALPASVAFYGTRGKYNYVRQPLSILRPLGRPILAWLTHRSLWIETELRRVGTLCPMRTA